LKAALTPEERCGADAPTVPIGAADQTSTVGPVAGEAGALLAVAAVPPVEVAVPPAGVEELGVDEQAAKAHTDAAATTPVSAFICERRRTTSDGLR
jgi:hypothetical protein